MLSYFEKYDDVNHNLQAIELLELFQNSLKKNEKIIYGNKKFIIYDIIYDKIQF